MSLYAFVLFLHVVGAMGLFVALGLEWVSLSYLRGATSAEQAKLWAKVSALLPRIGGPAMGITLLCGIFLTVQAWGWDLAWIRCSMLGILAIAVLGGALSAPAMAAIKKSLDSEAARPFSDVRDRLRSPRLSVSLRIRTALALGVVFLMTARPPLVGSILTLATTLVVGLVLSIPTLGRDRELRATRS